MQKRFILKQVTRENFPYTFARVSAMRSKLLKKEEYHKFLKMDLPTITRYLQDSEYKDSITKLSTEYEGVELVDMALRREQYRKFNKLREISPMAVNEVIDLYLKRFDIQNLKVVLRGIFSEATKEEVFAMLEPNGKYRKEYYMELFEIGSIHKVLKTTKLVFGVEQAYEEFKKTNNLLELENALDKYYYKDAVEGAQELDEYGLAFKVFLLQRIDIININNLLRYKREGIDPNQILNYMIFEGLYLKAPALKKLAHKESIAALIKELKHSKYEKFISFDEKEELSAIELRLQKHMMCRSMKRTYQHPMSIETILTFMLMLVIEIKNLRMIIKAKHFGIEPEYIEKNLLII
jgi:V/A-type H+/Na+-transporting ATPase subunit C